MVAGDDALVSLYAPVQAHAPTASLCGSVRLVHLLLLHFGNVVCYASRAALSIAMVGSTGIAASTGWSSATQGLVLSAFFVSYSLAQLPAGGVAVRFGPRRVLVVMFVAQAALSAAFPWTVDSTALAAVLRILLGFAQSLYWPCLFQLLAAWIPVEESSRANCICDTGTSVVSSQGGSNHPWPCAFMCPTCEARP